MRIVWTTTALKRLADVALEIELENPDRAAEFVEQIFEKVDVLSEFPQLGRVVPEVGKAHIREIFFRQFRIVYGIQGSQVSIRTIRHTRERR